MQELRALCFEPQEVARAVMAYVQTRGERLPRGSLDTVDLTGAPDFRCRLSILDDHGGRHDRSFDRATVAASLIAWCMGRRVPLPAHARKGIEAVGGQAILTLWVEGAGKGMGKAGARPPSGRPQGARPHAVQRPANRQGGARGER
jgi:hypothetical protein